MLKKAESQGNVIVRICDKNAGLKTWGRALRLHQWVKNLLIFVPLLTAHQFSNPQLLLTGLLAFFAFGMCASSVYFLNDLIDLQDDRHHSSKRNRPFAAGAIPISTGLLGIPLLLASALTISLLWLPLLFTLVLVTYTVLTLMYSLYLKKLMSVDIIVLAMLYTIRLVAGAAAFSIPLTFWLLSFSMFIFLSLALVKRYSELREARQKGRAGKTRGRGYYPDDLEMISSLGAASGYLSVMVLALYVHDLPEKMYSNNEILWLSCPLLLLWITRIWMLTHRGQMHDDPVVFAVKDKVSLVTGLVFGIIFYLAA